MVLVLVFQNGTWSSACKSNVGFECRPAKDIREKGKVLYRTLPLLPTDEVEVLKPDTSARDVGKMQRGGARTTRETHARHRHIY